MRNTIHFAFPLKPLWGTVWLRLQWHHLFLMNCQCHCHLRLADRNTTLNWVMLQNVYAMLFCLCPNSHPTFTNKNKRNHDDFLTSTYSIRSWLSSFLELKTRSFLGNCPPWSTIPMKHVGIFWGERRGRKIMYPKFYTLYHIVGYLGYGRRNIYFWNANPGMFQGFVDLPVCSKRKHRLLCCYVILKDSLIPRSQCAGNAYPQKDQNVEPSKCDGWLPNISKDTDGKQKTIGWNPVNILNLAFKLENNIRVNMLVGGFFHPVEKLGTSKWVHHFPKTFRAFSIPTICETTKLAFNKSAKSGPPLPPKDMGYPGIRSLLGLVLLEKPAKVNKGCDKEAWWLWLWLLFSACPFLLVIYYFSFCSSRCCCCCCAFFVLK